MNTLGGEEISPPPFFIVRPASAQDACQIKPTNSFVCFACFVAKLFP
jgi:hypothetical protein